MRVELSLNVSGVPRACSLDASLTMGRLMRHGNGGWYHKIRFGVSVDLFLWGIHFFTLSPGVYVALGPLSLRCWWLKL